MICMQLYDMRDATWRSSFNGTGGCFLKCVQQEGNNTVYYKLSDFLQGYGFVGHESILEVIAYRVGNFLGFNVQPCTLRRVLVSVRGKAYQTYAMRSLSYCKKTETAMSYMSYYYTNRVGEQGITEFSKAQTWWSELEEMILFDFLINNVDRHGKNMEIITNQVTGKARLSPMYDNGCCLTFSCKNSLERVRAFDCTTDILANNFLGGISLYRNLALVTKPHYVNALTEESFKALYKGISSLIPQEYYSKITEMIMWRYKYLVNGGYLREKV